MKGCLAPSEIVTPQIASVFGNIAEELIYADFCQQYGCVPPQVFFDHHNPAGYLYFLAINNPHFDQNLQTDFYGRLRQNQLMKIPDIIVHKPTEKAFYEIKPKSASGMIAGQQKVGILNATYRFYHLPYIGGHMYQPRNHRLAFMGRTVLVTLKVERAAPGLIVYSICLEANDVLEVATIAALLRYVIGELNKQKGKGRIRPVDLQPLFQPNQPLAPVADALGLKMATAAVATATVAVGWKHFWKAVAKRFAARGALAAVLSVADGPLPVGELIAAGMAIWTIVDVIRLSDILWQDAAVIARQEA